ncbi:type 1 fimbrial protein [Burkholderia sp. AU19243]|uniref:fimbrial protein n=1 Tax=Burkholderia TaxID=32008 RepID=UPI00075341EF|nr:MULTISPECIES: fimbrial protein [Burkholderia]MBR8362319.1 type 1 fimbrial protein [Burkholderia sp. AU19243]MBY4697761.1 type 1 fimbrial protein [Burkholderia latens]
MRAANILCLTLILFVPLKGWALECFEDGSNAVTTTTTLPADLYILASTPDNTLIWQSPTFTRTFGCFSGMKEEVMIWVNPSKAKPATGAEVGLVINGKTYTQSSGAIPTGYTVPANGKRVVKLTYSLVLLRKGTGSTSGSTTLNNYGVFQLDGIGGVNPTPGRNFRHLISGTVKFTRGTCSLRAGDDNRTVPLPRVVTQKLPAVAGTAGRVPFSLQVQNCDIGVKGASFTFSGTPDSNDTNAFANTGTARGIAVYLRNADGNKLIRPTGQEGNVAPVSANVGKLALNAEYVVTRPAVNPGTVRALATFGITYQ